MRISTVDTLTDTRVTGSPDTTANGSPDTTANGSPGHDSEPQPDTRVTGSRDTTATADSADEEPQGPTGDPRALLAARLLAAAALVVSAYVHTKLAVNLGMGGPLLALGHLFAVQAVLSVVLVVALIARDNRVWLAAVVLSAAGLVAILASVYFPVPAIGPFPAINEPTWLLSKAFAAFAEITVIVLWLVRQIAPPQASR